MTFEYVHVYVLIKGVRSLPRQPLSFSMKGMRLVVFLQLFAAASIGMRSKTTTPFTIGRQSKVRTAADDLWEEGEEEGGGATGEGRGFDRENPLGTQVDEEVSSQSGAFKPVFADDGFIVARSEPTRQVNGERGRERERERERDMYMHTHQSYSTDLWS